MLVRVKLMGAFKSKNPPGGTLQLPDKATINDALAALEIDGKRVQIVMVNSKPQPNRAQPLSENDELTVLSPVGGG